MEKIFSGEYNFLDFAYRNAICNLVVYRSKRKDVVICYESDKNTGASITNSVEELIVQVVATFGLDLAKLTWYEVYNGKFPFDSYSEVKFGHYAGVIQSVRWEQKTKKGFEKIVQGLENKCKEVVDNRIKVLVVKCNEKPIVLEIENALEVMQGLVGGYIECVAIGEGLVLVVNEEGRIRGLPINRYLNRLDMPGFIVGDFFVAAIDQSHGEFMSLAQKQIDKYIQIFQK